ncbi:MAG: glycerophosphodiester phosphodiesterase [Acidimicrobiales bacterium]
MLVIAHRGASRDFAENTLDAFLGAIDQGADGVELDVRRTSDGRLAVHHDDTLADGRAIVATSFDRLPPAVPDLATTLDACAPLGVVNVEIKNWPEDRDFDPTEQLAGAVVELLEGRGELDDGRILVSSFHLPTIDRVHQLAPNLATGWLLGLVESQHDLVDRAAERGHGAVHPHHAFVNEDLVRIAHAAGIAVNTWTCDEPERIRWLADLGVDAVITNTPAVALEALGRGSS